MTRDPRSVIRSLMSAPQHAPAEPLQEDYATSTVGSQADAGMMGNQAWPGSRQFDMGEDEGCPFEKTARALNEYQAGELKDEEAIDLFRKLIETGLIEYMNDDVRNTASALARVGYLNNVVSEAEAFKRDTTDQQAQQDTPNIQVRAATQYKTNATAPVSPIGNVGDQQAQMAPAQVPPPPTGQVTSKGHDKFPDSGGKKENPPKVPNPVGKQKAGPNHGDEMAGGGKGMVVGQSLQQGMDAEDGEYEGSKVGSVKEEMSCPLPPKDTKKKKPLRRVKRRRPEPEE